MEKMNRSLPSKKVVKYLFYNLTTVNEAESPEGKFHLVYDPIADSEADWSLGTPARATAWQMAIWQRV